MLGKTAGGVFGNMFRGKIYHQIFINTYTIRMDISIIIPMILFPSKNKKRVTKRLLLMSSF